ncbi:hypothetical protein [Desulforegula conservatrix]|uniref:hypothetical protein n=1 Tax=Desulforegula conservatrix TaxID=153026 RepID=UPI0004831115|nr:hypothetical protein [Desulforegula conservatrix]
MNKLLSLFGLVKIKRAISISARLHQYYVKCVQTDVKERFGVDPTPGAIHTAKKWWEETLPILFENNSDDIHIGQEPKFTESNLTKQ